MSKGLIIKLIYESKQFESQNNKKFDDHIIDVIVQYLFYMKG